MNLRRRTFLKWTAAGTAAVGLPAWIAGCQGSGSRREAWTAGEPGPVLDALRAGSEAGRPVLVLVVPTAARWEFGRAWGDALEPGDAELLADLALCELVCATMAEVRAALPGLPPTAGEPLALLLETHVPRAVSIEGPLPEVTYDPFSGPNPAEVELRTRHLAQRVRAAVAPDRGTIERRAAQALAANEIEAPAEPLDHPGLARTVPALIRAAGEVGEEPRRRALAILAGAAAARLQRMPPRGAYWARETGCGYDVEGLEPEGGLLACGMGHVPDPARRFLYYHTGS